MPLLLHVYQRNLIPTVGAGAEALEKRNVYCPCCKLNLNLTYVTYWTVGYSIVVCI
jgi:hypothetical protein